MTALTCPRCSIQLQEGYLLDEARNQRTPTDWIEGKPERSFWTGLKLKGRARLRVASWRCPRCGLLELHAPATSEGAQ